MNQTRPSETDPLPSWMLDVLCDLQKAAEAQGLRGFSQDIRRLRTRYPAGGDAMGLGESSRLC